MTPIWLLCNSSSVFLCPSSMMMCLPFISILSITARSSPNVHYFSSLVKSCFCLLAIIVWCTLLAVKGGLVWYCQNKQSAIKRSAPGLWIILILYWSILSNMHCNLCDKVTTSFLKMAISGLWSVYLPLLWISSDGTPVIYVVFPMLLSWCFCIFFSDCISFCWQM